MHASCLMARPVLIVAPARAARKLADAVGDAYATVACSDREKAIALAATGTYLAIVIVDGFAELVAESPMIHVSDPATPELHAELAAIGGRARRDHRARAAEVEHLAALAYDEYIELARARAARDYLLALLHRHRGVVSEAARSAGVLRETLHRLIRRHDIEPDWFRDDKT